MAGALSAAFLPVFTHLRTHRRNQAAARLAGVLLTLGCLVLLIIGLAGFIFAHQLTSVVAPGFAPAGQQLLANLTRIMLLSPLLFLISNLLGNMLISTKSFFFYGLSPALYNLGIVLGIVLLSPSFGIYGAAWGTVLGAALHLAARLLGSHRAQLTVQLNLRITPEMKKVLRLMLPRLVGLTATQVQLWAFVAIASTLGEGAVTVHSLARNFQSFPVSLIGIALATSLFPLLATSASRGARGEFTEQLRWGVFLTLAATIPAALGIYLLRQPIIAFFVGTGAFDASAITATAWVLGVYTLSIPTESLLHLLSRSFYALHNTLIPTVISVVSLAVSIIAAYFLVIPLHIAGLPAGFAIGTALQVALLAGLLPIYSRRQFKPPYTPGV